MKLKIFAASILFISAGAAFATGTHNDDHGHSNNNQQTNENSLMYSVGHPAKYSPDNRQIKVNLLDTMRFEFIPALDTLKVGEAVTFMVRNVGKIKHEFSIGNAKEQEAHREMMKKMPTMMHQDDNTVSLAPNDEAEISWQFSGRDEVVFSCNIPGHSEAGMHHEAMIGKHNLADN